MELGVSSDGFSTNNANFLAYAEEEYRKQRERKEES